MKQLTVLLLTVFLSTPLAAVAATPPEETLRQQVVAIGEYVQRLVAPPAVELTPAELREVILDGADWLVSAQQSTGRFAYEYEPFSGEYLAGDNMVRQAGALFALSEVYQYQSQKNPAYAAAIENAIAYFERMSGTGESVAGEFWCIKNSARSNRCDLGSVALALIGILNYVAAEPTARATYADTIEKYVTYLKAAKFNGAGFSDKYYLGTGFASTESPFYTGEAMLALVNYYQYEADETVRDMLEDTFVYLSAKEAYESPLYLWIMAALKDMQRLWPSDHYVAYAQEFTSHRLSSSVLRHSLTHNYCAPLEGYVSAYSIFGQPESTEYREKLRTEMNFWLAKSAGLQLRQSSPYRVVTVAGSLQLGKLPNPTQAHGGFLTGEETLTQRIDFTQHCISSYLQKLVDIDKATL